MYQTDEIVQLKKNETITNIGDYIISKGYVACKAGKQLIYFAKQGDIILVKTHVSKHSLQFEAKSDVTLIRMPVERTLELLNRRNEWNEKLIAGLSTRIQFYNLPTKERLYTLLFQMGKEIGISSGADCFIPSVVTQKEMAIYMNCTREYLLSQKRLLQEEGVLSKGEHWILLRWDQWLER
ncbi:hypothetical protein BMT55_12880 [Listeria newyorkensis]|uniref:Crp/Fnr family transcriptional regulator n=1 Tax=Listeria newyorkensis TaxID=1497681 RepID=A0ABX4XQZ3_9LIST|nr:Crp/Fnr family transcriptional regulator [Listeria newyorkensis]KGL45571.1 hypothetical protein EP58_03650 [Listeria newyorkensis]PNP89386.1 hypothetical protein BMT55_12880 [Listeria newyorkensis]WAO22956.1 Crp/Fnr family transcriptional regulator [Listeria newyorkensis]SQC57216.1 Uncharacterised protein [Listeria newyorkensis]